MRANTCFFWLPGLLITPQNRVAMILIVLGLLRGPSPNTEPGMQAPPSEEESLQYMVIFSGSVSPHASHASPDTKLMYCTSHWVILSSCSLSLSRSPPRTHHHKQSCDKNPFWVPRVPRWRTTGVLMRRGAALVMVMPRSCSCSIQSMVAWPS